ncbi:MAG: hypothetical protein ACO1RX_06875 [Candidatus Sericytochromatia bacterium]
MMRKTLPIYARTRAMAASSGLNRNSRLVPIEPVIYDLAPPLPVLETPYRLNTLAGRNDVVWHASSLQAGHAIPMPVWRRGFRDGLAHKALFNKPTGLAVDRRGNVYVADSLNHVIRRISPRGKVSTVAGSGERGLHNAPGRQARFNYPTGLAMAADQTLYVVDQGNQLVRVLHRDGRITSLALPGRPLGGIAVNARGQLYLLISTDAENCHLLRLDPQRGQSELLADWEGRWQWLPYRAGEEEQPFSRWSRQRAQAPRPLGVCPAAQAEGLGLAVGPHQELVWICGSQLWRLQDGPQPELVPQTLRVNWPGAHWQGLSIDPNGDIHVIDARHHRLCRIGPSGQLELVMAPAPLLQPYAVIRDGYGQLFLSDTGHWRICQLTPPGRELYLHLARLAFLPYSSQLSSFSRLATTSWSKGIQSLLERHLRRQRAPASAPLPSVPIVAEKHVLDVLRQGNRSQQLACVKELVDHLRVSDAPLQHLLPLRAIFETLLRHPRTSVRTLLIRHICDTVHHEQDALFWLELLDQHQEPNRLLKKYLIEVLTWMGRRFELYGHVVPLLVEYVRAPEEDVAEHVFQHLLRIRAAGYESLVDPLIEELGAD